MFDNLIDELKEREKLVKAANNIVERIEQSMRYNKQHEINSEGEYLKDDNDDYIMRDPIPEDEGEYSWSLPYSENKLWTYLVKCLADGIKNNKIK